MVIMPAGQSCRDLGVSLDEMKSFALAEIDWKDVLVVVSGFEPGWDQAVGLTAIDLGIPLHLVIPFHGWQSKWSEAQQKKCQKMIEGSTIFTYWTEKIWLDTQANQYMASLSDQV